MLPAPSIEIDRLVGTRAWSDKETGKMKTAVRQFLALGLLNVQHSNRARWPANYAAHDRDENRNEKARSWSLTTKASEVATGDTQERVFEFRAEMNPCVRMLPYL